MFYTCLPEKVGKEPCVKKNNRYQFLSLKLLLCILALSPHFIRINAEQADPTARAVLVAGSGDYSRRITTDSTAAQQYFDQGLRLAWGFYFPESIASYQEAARLDPGSPMPYWGMAHAMGPNPNSRYARMPDDPKGEGLKAINKALARLANASDLEKSLIQALFVLYDKESIADDTVRDRAYLKEMRELNSKHPDDPDIAALYAASYMSIGRWNYWDSQGSPKDETLPVALALEHIIEQGVDHPGVYHLHVHLIEASMQPERALVSADRLEQTVPIAGHVVHMPAHIYVRTGQYQKAIDNNIRSQQVDKAFAEIWGDHPLPNIGTYPLSHKIHAGHAIDFIRYAATVQGNYEVAIKAAHQASALSATNAQRNQRRIAAVWLVEKIFGKWHNLLSQQSSPSGLPYLDGIRAYALGSAYLATADKTAAQAQLKQLQSLANAANADEYRVGATAASAVLKLASISLQGELLEASGDLEGAIAAYRRAVALEDQNNYTEPPDWPQPMRHYLGAALLKAGRNEEAEQVYRKDLLWNQKNGWSLFGLQLALKKQGKKAEAETIREQFEIAWRFSNTELSQSHL
jgi:tetratricopeptide (TPR) repeat protein